MCGILALLGYVGTQHDVRAKALRLSKKLRHRGPDWNGIVVDDSAVMCHERLAIVDPGGGAQPILNQDKSIVLTVNGEIYNHKALKEELGSDVFLRSQSDCEAIIPLYEKYGDAFVAKLDGDFAFVLWDRKNKRVLAARDPIGVAPLYIGWGSDNSLWFASEMKALIKDCARIEVFPPGNYYTAVIPEGRSAETPIEGAFTRYWNPVWWNAEHVPKTPVDLLELRRTLEEAVVKRLMTDVPYGVLISGGLDSSVIAAVACRHAAMRVEENEKTKAWWPQIHSFSIGLPDSPDCFHAQKVADYLGTVHHNLQFTVEEGLDAIPDVIYHLETYDVTSIRASTPMYFLARKIKAMGVKMVLSGEGADEVFGGYLYFHQAPSAQAFQEETVRRVKGLHAFDVLRANKSTMAWGLEVRVPFLDKAFLEYSLDIAPEDKQPQPGKMEKHIVRKAFDTPEKPYLPESILWRQKEQFSDGVGYGWIDGIKAHAEKMVSDEELAKAESLYPYDTPKTKEAYWFRSIFETQFPHENARRTVDNWVPTWGKSRDPSGRVQQVHEAHTDRPLVHDKDY